MIEYKSIDLPLNEDPAAVLNEHGKEGWECCGMVRVPRNEVAVGGEFLRVMMFRRLRSSGDKTPHNAVLDFTKISLRCGWIAQDEDGATALFSKKPVAKPGRQRLNDDDDYETGLWLPSREDDDEPLALYDILDIPWNDSVPWSERCVRVGNAFHVSVRAE